MQIMREMSCGFHHAVANGLIIITPHRLAFGLFLQTSPNLLCLAPDYPFDCVFYTHIYMYVCVWVLGGHQVVMMMMIMERAEARDSFCVN